MEKAGPWICHIVSVIENSYSYRTAKTYINLPYQNTETWKMDKRQQSSLYIPRDVNIKMSSIFTSRNGPRDKKVTSTGLVSCSDVQTATAKRGGWRQSVDALS